MLSAPNFSRNASARTIATIASPITAAADTAEVSARSRKAREGSWVDRSTVRNALAIVEIGFIAAATTTASPLVMPPSSPPRRLLERTRRPPSRSISSCTSLERLIATSNPRPISTPFGVYGHDRVGELGVELIAPVHVRPQTRRAPFGHHDELPA